jgi:hypothetical protein
MCPFFSDIDNELKTATSFSSARSRSSGALLCIGGFINVLNGFGQCRIEFIGCLIDS